MFHVFRKRCGRFGNRVWMDWLYTEFHELKENIPRKSWQNIAQDVILSGDGGSCQIIAENMKEKGIELGEKLKNLH